MTNAVKQFWRKQSVMVTADNHKQHKSFIIGRLLILSGISVLPILLLLAIAIGLLYVRLLNGAISLTFLKKPIERSISSELPNLKVSIGQPVVALKDHGFEIQLKDIRLADKSGEPVAFAPLAAVKISPWALLGGVISPSQIILIEPRLLVFYTSNDGLSLAIEASRSDVGMAIIKPEIKANAPNSIERQETSQVTSHTFSYPESKDLTDLERIIANLSPIIRQQSLAKAHLNRISLRKAMIIIDYEGDRTAFEVQAANFNLTHTDVRSVLSGNIAFYSKRGIWHLGLQIEDTKESNRVHLSVVVKDLYPQAIADVIPKLKALDHLQLPISVRADYFFSPKDRSLNGILEIEFGTGQFLIPALGKESLFLNSGRARLVYSNEHEFIKLETANLNWSQSNITLTGVISYKLIDSIIPAWEFEIQSVDGYLSTTGDNVSVDLKRFVAIGTLLPHQGIINLDKTLVEAGSGKLSMNGIIHIGSSPRFSIIGKFSPMSVKHLLAYWPQYLSVDSRKWIVNNIHSGELLEGTFTAHLGAPASSNSQYKKNYSVVMYAKLADVRFRVSDKLPLIHASQAYLNFKDDLFSARIPECALILSNNQSLLISGLNFETTDIFEPEIDGNATFKIEGSVEEALELISKVQGKSSPTLANIKKRFSGKLEGNLSIIVPIHRNEGLPPPKIKGYLHVSDGRAENVWKTFNINGSNITLNLTENDILVSGDVLLKGIPINIYWRKDLRTINNALPFTLDASFDDADRNALGLHVNHLIKGPIQVSATVPSLKADLDSYRQKINFRVDLTSATLNIASLSWKKPIGHKAIVDLSVTTNKRGEWKLSDLRITGDRIAARGEALVNSKGELSSFNIEDFTIDIITRLRIEGKLNKDNIWRVSVSGKSFEGRNFLRDLFSPKSPNGYVSSTSAPNFDLNVKIDNVLGYWDTSLKNLSLRLSKRDGKITNLAASGNFKNGSALKASLKRDDESHQIVIVSNDSGQALKLVGFYPNVRNGQLRSIIDIESNKSGTRRGILTVRRFGVLGDKIVTEVLNQRQQTLANSSDLEREIIEFDWMQVPFVVGRGRFVLSDAELRGPLLGVMLCGKADFTNRQIQVAGTYIPLQGLSSVVSSIPGIGNLLAGTKGEGVIGINFEVLGTLKQPQVIINPLSAVTPGIFRQLFKVACPDTQFAHRETSANHKLSKRPKIDKSWASKTFKSED
ncbi:MAG: hypothetical protein HRT83_04570 [Hyphomicrobiaceae bacterium]|nr:hypothetical protein [Hyphomicrobiaceae bacterium]